MAVNRRASIRRRSENPRSWKTARPGALPPAPPTPPTSPDIRRPRKRRPIEPEGLRAEPPAPSPPRGDLEAAIDHFTRSWDRGEKPRAEGYVDRLSAEDRAEIIYHEFCLAEAAGLDPDPAVYLRRFPAQARSLGRLFSLHGAFSDSGLRDLVDRARAPLPESGDEIGPYRLARELGRGAFARVFLAEQADLGDRQVVVKVSNRASSEPKLLARARHPHIVEVLRQAEAEAEDGGPLHLICMPFLGGATLSSVLEARRALGRPARSGRDLLADLDRVAAPEYPRVAPDRAAPPGMLDGEPARPAREVIAGLSHPRALAWVVARLAEGLDHAHRRGVTHGDLKPSNILLTADGVPMLFDFNLAVDRLEAEAHGTTAADSGGTLAYMAPERLRVIAEAAAAPETGRPGKGPDPHRADLYGLGLVLLEALTGRRPPMPRREFADASGLAAALLAGRGGLPTALVGPQGRSIPPALRSILAKCLAPDPLDRYASGAELAEDLDRWRRDRRLAFAEEHALAGLARLARRRRPALLAGALTLATALAATVVANALIAGTRRDQALSKLGPIYDRADSGSFDFRPDGRWRLHDNDDLAELSARQLARYDAGVAPDWPDRADVRALPDRERGELEAWLCEHALRYALALGRRIDSPEDWRRGLSLLDRTIARFPLPTLKAARLSLLDKLGGVPAVLVEATGPPAPRWMDRYLTGVAAEMLDPRAALDCYADALRDRPGFFWAHYRAASAACRIFEYPIAVDHLRHCVGRRPANAAVHAQLASTLYLAGISASDGLRGDRLADALSEADRAIALDADLAPAYRIRAVIRHASGRRDEVESDIGRFSILAQALGKKNEGLALRLNLGNNPEPPPARPAAKASTPARLPLAGDFGDPEARISFAIALVRDGRIVDALAELDRVLEVDPGNLRARYHRARQLRQVDPERGYVELASLIEQDRFEELLTQEPGAIRAIHNVATDLLDVGRVDDALGVAERGLALSLRHRALRGDTVKARGRFAGKIDLEPRGESYYLLARIHATAARTEPGRIDRVVECLERAFASDDKFHLAWFADDRRFDEIRDVILARLASPVVDH